MSNPVHELLAEERVEKLLEMRATGCTWAECAQSLGMDIRDAQRLLTRAADRAAARNDDLIREKRLEQDARLEALWRSCMAALAAGFCDKAARVAVSILDRQARLLGLDSDREKEKGSKGWADPASIKDLIREAKGLGLPIPENLS